MPVAHGARVGELGLAGELALGLTDRVVGAPDTGSLRGIALGTGGYLKAPQLLLGQRGLLVGVLLFAHEQAPKQGRELAGGRHDRDRVTAAGTDALIEGVQRTGRSHRRPARLHQRVTRTARPTL